VKVLTEVLSLVNPSASSRALRVRRLVSHIVERLQLRDAWQLELASLLSQIGYLTLGVEPDARDGDLTSIEARRHQQMHPAAARDLLANIPRLEQVAAIVGRQRDGYDPKDASVPIRGGMS
jgi:response regulator RpfG family c-di-GMP phosphodiesterase